MKGQHIRESIQKERLLCALVTCCEISVQFDIKKMTSVELMGVVKQRGLIIITVLTMHDEIKSQTNVVSRKDKMRFQVYWQYQTTAAENND